jgi:serine/threonine-protein kinase
VRAVAEALDYAHQRQLLHRDVKPANILISQPDSTGERILLADFGIARWVDDASGLTGTNMTVGTVAYAAPEQLMGEQLDGRADQYALAATAFHLLTGAPLFAHSNPAVVISQHLSAPPPSIATRRPALSDLGPVFSKALAKAPADRYDTCTAFADALAQRLGAVAAQTGATEATVSAPATSGPQHSMRPRRRTREEPRRPRGAIVVAVALGALLVGVAAVALVLFGHDRHVVASPAPSQRAHAQASPSAPPASPPAPAVPVVLIGADCATLGAAGVSASGAQAYCSKLSLTGDTVWSLYSGAVPAPSVTPGATDEVYPDGIEQQVRVCVQQTGQTRLKCREDIRRGNLYGPP